MPFRQEPSAVGNQYADDRVLRSYLRRALPPEVLREVGPELEELGGLAGGELYRMQLDDRLNEPRLARWDAWGARVDRIEVSPLWRAAERGLVAVAYERRRGPHSRVRQAGLAHLFTPSTDIYSCPLAMTDGAARTLLASGNQRLIERVVPRLTSRDPARFWTGGQWMTGQSGGSDVSRTETVARRDGGGVWRLYGRKWFTSATDARVALTPARPEGEALRSLKCEAESCARAARESKLAEAAAAAVRAVEHAEGWLGRARKSGPELLEAGARRFALTLRRAHARAFLARHAQ